MSLAPSSELSHMAAFSQLAPEFTSEAPGCTGFFCAFGINMRGISYGAISNSTARTRQECCWKRVVPAVPAPNRKPATLAQPEKASLGHELFMTSQDKEVEVPRGITIT